MQEMLLAYPNLRVVEASVEDIILNEEEKVKGIVTQDGKKNLSFSQYFHIRIVFLFFFMSYACHGSFSYIFNFHKICTILSLSILTFESLMLLIGKDAK